MRIASCTVPWLLFVVGFDFAHAENACQALRPTERTRLEGYVRKRFKVSAETQLQIAESPAPGAPSCFKKLEFRSADATKRFQLTLYSSPDLRFLTHELLDTLIDPDIEERRKQAELDAGLTSGDFATIGPQNAPAVLTVFSDFQCPYCSRLARMLRQDIMPVESRNLRVVFRHYPLPGHPWARPAAKAAVCTQEQNNESFWKLHDFLFEHQRDFTPENILQKVTDEVATSPRFDRKRFGACMTDKAAEQKIERDVTFGSQHGVRGTPTLFMNGKRLSASEPEQIRTWIREIVAKSGKTTSKAE